MTSLLRSLMVTERSFGYDYPDMVTFNGVTYPLSGLQQTLTGTKEEIEGDFVGLVQGAYQRNGIVFACMLARQLIFSQARFRFQALQNGQPGELFGTPALDILDRPWHGGVTADLLSKMLTDADLAGTAFIARRGNHLKRMRPDWVTIVLGSFEDADVEAGDLDAETLGYIYHPGGKYSGRKVVPLLRDEVAQFQYVPDPTAEYRGMSWITPIIREVMGDSAATTHKLLFFENGATPNMVVSLDPSIQKQAYDDWVIAFQKAEPARMKAYKTLYLGGGAKAQVVGADLKQLDFKLTQGAGETRIAAAARVPPIIVGLSEGLEAATYSNYGQARRALSDGTIWPLWGNAASSLEVIVPPPSASRLWVDASGVPFLREDEKDLAEIQGKEAQTIRTLVDGGYRPDTVVGAVKARNWNLLDHTGMFSVQLQPPGTKAPEVTKPVVPQLTAGRSEEVRCGTCDRLLAESATPPYRIVCSRCKNVTETDGVQRGEFDGLIAALSRERTVTVTSPEVRPEIHVAAPDMRAVELLVTAVRSLMEREQAAPIVNIAGLSVAPPIVNIAPAEVHLPAPIIHVEPLSEETIRALTTPQPLVAPVVNVITPPELNVHILSEPRSRKRTKVTKRNNVGQVDETVTEEIG